MPAEASVRSIVVGAASTELRRALGPTSWIVLEELLLRSSGTADECVACVSVRSLAASLGLAKDTAARAIRRLRDSGLVIVAQQRTAIKDAHASDGTLTLADVVPVGASAVTLNLTIVAPTSSAGFLAVTPGDAATYVASSINWSAAGAVIANGGVAKIDTSRQIRVFAGGAIGTVDFVVDVTGYYV